jgi:hypothetical protein
MTMAPIVFGWAMAAYALSFALAAVSRGGAAVPGYYCAFVTFVRPLVMDSRFFEGKTAEHIALLISGWINIAFLASLAIRWRSGNGRAFRVLRTTTLLMIPFCWIVFYDEGLCPREGHVLWIVGMVLALFQKARLRAIR